MKTYNKNLVLIILLLFVGQVVSAPFLTCKSSQIDSHSVSVMDMSSHDMLLLTSSEAYTSSYSDSSHETDCCPDECHCPSGMCFSIVYFIDQGNEINFSNFSNEVDFSKQVIANQTLSSIHRPPIFS